ncbi:hypothetical protein VTG60DRAFT_4372 [Thermothelomyces hinnuleus]
MTAILDQRGNEVKITEEVVKAAAENPRFGKEVIALLLNRRGTEVKITEEVVKAAARNDNGDEVMILLLDHRGTEVEITEEVIKEAAKNERGDKIMALLLLCHGIEVKITEEVASNASAGYEAIRLLCYTTGIALTTGVVEAAATSGQEEVLRFLDLHFDIGSDIESWLRIARLYNAAKMGDAAAVHQLVDNGTPLNLQNIRGVTPLWIASARGHEAVVRVLLATDGVDVNTRRAGHQSPSLNIMVRQLCRDQPGT